MPERAEGVGENQLAADYKAITKEKKYWLLTAQTPSDYESGPF